MTCMVGRPEIQVLVSTAWGAFRLTNVVHQAELPCSDLKPQTIWRMSQGQGAHIGQLG